MTTFPNSPRHAKAALLNFSKSLSKEVGHRGVRVNTISPGIVMTPLARDELSGPCGEGYRRMIELCPAGRAATPDEIGMLGAFLMGFDGAFITGSDFLIDGGVTASYFYGELAPT
jgi:NAD(P)-dependent dehydrogenase (short-subunit alcohol dehydrogenase family)